MYCVVHYSENKSVCEGDKGEDKKKEGSENYRTHWQIHGLDH